MHPTTLAVGDQFVRELKIRGWSLSVGESCIGGLLSATVAHGSGVSAVFTHGFTCYSNLAKMDILGVEASVMERFGAVSQQVAVQMAEGAAAAGRTDIGLGLTGIAGPTGGTPKNLWVWFWGHLHSRHQPHETMAHKGQPPGYSRGCRKGSANLCL